MLYLDCCNKFKIFFNCLLSGALGASCEASLGNEASTLDGSISFTYNKTFGVGLISWFITRRKVVLEITMLNSVTKSRIKSALFFMTMTSCMKSSTTSRVKNASTLCRSFSYIIKDYRLKGWSTSQMIFLLNNKWENLTNWRQMFHE